MEKLLVALPLFGSVSVTFFDRWNQLDKSPMVRMSSMKCPYIHLSMRTIVEESLAQTGWDRLVILEHDMIPPIDALVRIATVHKDHDIVGCMYFKHEPPHYPYVWNRVGNEPCDIEAQRLSKEIKAGLKKTKRTDENHRQQAAARQRAYELELLANNRRLPPPIQVIKQWCDKPGLYECDAVGMGLTSISRKMLEAWPEDISMFNAPAELPYRGSHDLWFCDKAKDQGFKVWCDSGLIVEHLTTVPVGLSHALDHMIVPSEVGQVSFNKK